MSASTSHTRPLVVPPSRMERSSQGRTEDDASRDRAASGTSSNASHQQLPPFRELLPQHLHDEIEAPRYGDSSSNQSAATSPNFAASMPFGRPSPVMQESDRSRLLPSERYGDFPSRYQFPPSMPPSETRRPSLSSSSSSGHFSRSELPAPYNGSRPTNTSLPPFSDLSSLSDRAMTADRQPPVPPTHYPTSYTHGPSTFSEPERFGTRAGSPYSLASGQSPRMSGGGIYADRERRGTPYHGQYSDMDYSQQYPSGSQPPNFGVMGQETMDARNKRRRGNLPKPVTDILRTWFLEHLDHPYPSEEDKQMFIARTGLSISQISNWFINARRRQLPALRNQVRAQDPERGNYDSAMSDLDRL